MAKIDNTSNTRKERFRDRRELSAQSIFYSLDKIDTLTVSISGAGIYVCLQTIKYLADKSIEADLLIKLTGGFFLLGILLNFLSQYYGYKTSEQDYLRCEAELDDDPKDKIDKYRKSSNRFSKLTAKFTIVGVISMLLGLFSIMIYFLFFFRLVR